jgi:phospholipid/cholesterol/gamma-HCH transport system substrate-binding protein
VSFTVRNEVRDALRADAAARIGSMGVLGDKLLEVAPGTAPQPLPENVVLHGRSEVGLTDLIEPGRRSLTRVDSLLADLEAISGGLREGEGSLGKLLSDDELHARLIGTLEETRATLADLRRTQATVAARLSGTASSFAAAAGSIDSLASGWRRGDGTIHRLAEDPALYENLNAATARLERMLADVERGDGLLARMLKDPEFADQVTGLVVDLRALLVDMREHPGRYVSFSLF